MFDMNILMVVSSYRMQSDKGRSMVEENEEFEWNKKSLSVHYYC